MVSALKYKIRMYFITHNNYTMFDTNIAKFNKFFCRPHTPNRIMRTAKNKQPDFFRNYFIFKIFKINMITIIVSEIQFIFNDFSAVVPNNFIKRIIYRCLYQNTFTDFRIRFHCHGKRKYNSGSFNQPFFLNVPVMMFFQPVCQNFKIWRLHFTVAENPMLGTFN